MGKWKFSFPIDGLHDVIKQKDPKKGPTIKIDEVFVRKDLFCIQCRSLYLSRRILFC